MYILAGYVMALARRHSVIPLLPCPVLYLDGYESMTLLFLTYRFISIHLRGFRGIGP